MSKFKHGDAVVVLNNWRNRPAKFVSYRKGDASQCWVQFLSHQRKVLVSTSDVVLQSFYTSRLYAALNEELMFRVGDIVVPTAEFFAEYLPYDKIAKDVKEGTIKSISALGLVVVTHELGTCEWSPRFWIPKRIKESRLYRALEENE